MLAMIHFELGHTPEIPMIEHLYVVVVISAAADHFHIEFHSPHAKLLFQRYVLDMSLRSL